MFQKWLKSNAGKTYGDAINAYYQILEEKKKGKTTIDKQFEYNTYIRDFFEDNQGRDLEEAIICWKYKKSLQGHNRYEKSDLVALDWQLQSCGEIESNRRFEFYALLTTIVCVKRFWQG